MQYMGGKARLSKYIVPILESYRKSNQLYLEPFMGACNIVSKMSGLRVASDYHYELVELFRALQSGWIPPQTITEDDYHCAKIGAYPAHLTAFIGFGCSFGGKWFGGYARDKRKIISFAETSKNGLIDKMKDMKDVTFLNCSYSAYNPSDCLIYCDPPYTNTTKYSNSNQFDHNKFWDTMRKWSLNNTVIISEYKAPDDFKCIKEFNHTTGLRNNKDKTISKIERLFIYEN